MSKNTTVNTAIGTAVGLSLAEVFGAGPVLIVALFWWTGPFALGLLVAFFILFIGYVIVALPFLAVYAWHRWLIEKPKDTRFEPLRVKQHATLSDGVFTCTCGQRFDSAEIRGVEQQAGQRILLLRHDHFNATMWLDDGQRPIRKKIPANLKITCKDCGFSHWTSEGNVFDFEPSKEFSEAHERWLENENEFKVRQEAHMKRCQALETTYLKIGAVVYLVGGFTVCVICPFCFEWPFKP